MLIDRRGLLALAGMILAGEIVMPLARALAAEAAPGFSATQPQFTPDQRALVSAISERIIPTTDTPGAIAAGVPAFIEMMLVDSYAPGDRDDFMNQLGMVEGHARIHYEKAFVALSPDEQDQVLTWPCKAASRCWARSSSSIAASLWCWAITPPKS